MRADMGHKARWILLVLLDWVHAEASARPNVVLILADDLGYSDVSWTGGQISTPTLDGLATAGVKMTQYFGHSICTPSRSSLLTGKYAFHTGMQHSYLIQGAPVGLPLNISTIAEEFKKIGYDTHMVGKWHLGFTTWEYTPLERGFDTYFGYLGGGEDYYTHEEGGFVDLRNGCDITHASGNYSASLFVDKAVARLPNASDTSPFFLYLAFQSVHSPLEAPPSLTHLYPEIADFKRRTMAQMVTGMDSEIGRLVAELKARKLWENTLLFFASDNGGPPYVANSNWPMRGGKWTMWQGGAHLASFLVHGNPAVFQGLREFPHLTHHMDVLPTLLAAAGSPLRSTNVCSRAGQSLQGQCCPGNDLQRLDELTEDSCCASCLALQGCAAYSFHLGTGQCWLKASAVSCEPGDCDSWRKSPAPSPSFPACPSGIDGKNLWPYLTSQQDSSNLRNRTLVLNVDPTNTKAGVFDAGGWAGYAAIHSLEWKLMLGDGGTPNGLCWPPEGHNASGTCSYSGKVPSDLDTPHLYDLSVDPSESVDVAVKHPNIVAMLQEELVKFVSTTCEPLNMHPAGRQVDPAAKARAQRDGAWGPWKPCSTKTCRCEQAVRHGELTV